VFVDFKKILWPNDLTDSSNAALPFVVSLAEKFEAELHVVYVGLDLSRYGEYWGKPDPRHVEGMHDFALRGAKKKLAEFCTGELADCPAYHIHVELGDPAGEILNVLDEVGADLVVVSTGGNPARPRLGSVAGRVIQESPVPVLAVNPGRLEQEKEAD
jgi:nucleotide-binding universal stress UspA family protein